MGKLAIFLAHHLRRPRGGLVGRLLTWRMARANAALNAWSLSLLDLQPLDCVLELGCGPGHAVQGAAAGASFVAGIDVSEAALRQARARNRAAIRAGRVELRRGDVRQPLPYEDASFDAAFAVQLFYFIPDPLPVLHEMRRVLRPGGALAIALRDAETLAQSQFAQTGIYALWREVEIVALFEEAGFEGVRVERSTFKHGEAICVLGTAPRS